MIQFIIRIPHRLKERAEKGTILTNALKMNHVLIRIAHPFLEQLSHKYHETVHSAVQSDNSVIYLDKVESDSSIFINTQMGVKNYMYCTGVGKCLLSYKTEAQIDQILSFPLKAKTYNTITRREALLNELKLSRERGYSMDNEEIEIGLTCVGFPVFKGFEDPGFAISISGATGRILDKLHSTDLIHDMQAAAAAMSWQSYNYQLPDVNL